MYVYKHISDSDDDEDANKENATTNAALAIAASTAGGGEYDDNDMEKRELIVAQQGAILEECNKRQKVTQAAKQSHGQPPSRASSTSSTSSSNSYNIGTTGTAPPYSAGAAAAIAGYYTPTASRAAAAAAATPVSSPATPATPSTAASSVSSSPSAVNNSPNVSAALLVKASFLMNHITQWLRVLIAKPKAVADGLPISMLKALLDGINESFLSGGRRTEILIAALLHIKQEYPKYSDILVVPHDTAGVLAAAAQAAMDGNAPPRASTPVPTVDGNGNDDDTLENALFGTLADAGDDADDDEPDDNGDHNAHDDQNSPNDQPYTEDGIDNGIGHGNDDDNDEYIHGTLPSTFPSPPALPVSSPTTLPPFQSLAATSTAATSAEVIVVSHTQPTQPYNTQQLPQRNTTSPANVPETPHNEL